MFALFSYSKKVQKKERQTQAFTETLFINHEKHFGRVRFYVEYKSEGMSCSLMVTVAVEIYSCVACA